MVFKLEVEFQLGRDLRAAKRSTDFRFPESKLCIAISIIFLIAAKSIKMAHISIGTEYDLKDLCASCSYILIGVFNFIDNVGYMAIG